MSDSKSHTLLELKAVTKHFGQEQRGELTQRLVRRGLLAAKPVVRAVDHVDLQVAQGEVVGLVGESGCGKSTLGRMATFLLEPTQGDVYFEGESLAEMDADTRYKTRLAVQMIFQNPHASLNPRLRVDRIVGDALRIHKLVPAAQLDDKVSELMLKAGLDPSLRKRYPHEFSGGQRQRIGIARALAVNPRLIVCDEAVAALDVSIQAQILNLFMDLRTELDLSYLFISHDLSVVEHISDRVVIMYLGRVIESASVQDIFERPQHPYTQALLAEIPSLRIRKRSYSVIKGEMPSPLNPPSGCHFHPRCPFAMPKCSQESPALTEVAPQHRSACFLNSSHSHN
ncbi:ATP-binding cassette domain-containing protein [Paenalcaligenes niemegkensis]|uniref:ABC transporter ATP-binding protein n=1 Tax=Paenalcaligenes niemegkensis TaxID=2895469 RepID=UPI001EE82206|nr:oligopeptide/dipeptide ABC transporter ATP-binding protein [Paenalcaligenes niemegkensis]MCQ9617178.1 ATP-binding cassette domain-containing protein [Paenalcaligenes niemegkensis]